MVRVAIGLAAVAFLAIYLGQYWRTKPTDSDDGLVLDFIHQISLGARPYWDMVDIYGPLHWPLPVLFYKLAGQRVWGVHMWVLVVKVVSILLCYKVVASVAHRLYGALASLWLMVLLGQGWAPLQSAYAFLSVLPYIFGTWHIILSRPFRKPWVNAALASALTLLVIWTKLNTGLYLFAGACLALLSWGPARAQPESTSAPRFSVWLPRLQVLAAVVYALLLSRYLMKQIELLYVVYLAVPLAIILATVAFDALRSRPNEEEARERLLMVAIYAGGVFVASLLIFVGYYRGGIPTYLRELVGLLTGMHYHYPFPPVGKLWFFVGYNENYWPQIPWLVTALFAVWLIWSRRAGPRAFGDAWANKSAQVRSAFLLGTILTFVLYPRSDDMHGFQALLFAVPVLFILLHQMESFVRAQFPGAARAFRPVVAVAAVAYTSTIAIVPSLDVFALRPGDYKNPRFQYLDYRPIFNPKIRSFAPQVRDRDWDELVDQAASYIDSITEENEPIFVFCDVRLMYYLSRTTDIGGRYGYYFYLVAVSLLDRPGFDKLVPPSLVADVMAHPPRVIVTRGDNESFVPKFPELREFRDKYYVETKVFRYIHIYERKPEFRLDPVPPPR